LFEGNVIENTWRRNLDGQGYVNGIGHGRVEIGENGFPVAKIWSMVDDFLVHGATREQTGLAFDEFKCATGIYMSTDKNQSTCPTTEILWNDL
jgi:hypothetical protein